MSMDTSIQEVLHSVEEPLKNASVGNVYGDPIETQGKTLIPVAKIAYGFGGGAGKPHHNGKHGDAEGGGAGGGAYAAPYGVLEVTPDGTKLIRFTDYRRTFVAVSLGMFFGMILSSRRRRHREHKQ